MTAEEAAGTQVAWGMRMGIAQVLEHAPTLAGAEPEVIERMTALASVRQLRRGEMVHRFGEQPQGLTLLKSGMVKMVRPAPRGRSIICGLFGAPETLGDLALLKGFAYSSDAIVVTETASVINVPRQCVLSALHESAGLAESIACAIASTVDALHDKIDILSAGSVEGRLATLLLKLYDRFGDDFDDGTSRILVPLSRRELSELVSTSFETVIRVMTRWEREGVLRTEPKGFTIYEIDVLSRVAAGREACSPRPQTLISLGA